MLAKTEPVELHKLVTAMVGSPDFDRYMPLFLSEDNDTVDILVEEDNKTYTFFTMNKPRIKKELTNV